MYLMAFRAVFNVRLAVICLWLAAIAAVIVYIGPDSLVHDYRYVSPHGIRDLVLSYGAFSGAVYVFMQAIRPFTFLPPTPFTVAGGFVFGHTYGLLLSTVGTTIAALISFLMSRYLLSDYVKGKVGGRYAGVEGRIGKRGIFFIIGLRLIPVVPFDVVSYLSGISGVSLADYVIGTVLGELPGAFVLTMLGSHLMNVRSPIFIVSIVLAAILLLSPIAYDRLVKKKKDKN